jgi:hypothetical protein
LDRQPPPLLLIGSTTIASAADSIDCRRLYCDSTGAWLNLHLSRLIGFIFPDRLSSVAQLYLL